MKRRSIRFKFFVAISAVTLVFIGVLLILNLFFMRIIICSCGGVSCATHIRHPEQLLRRY